MAWKKIRAGREPERAGEILLFLLWFEGEEGAG